MDTNKTPIFGLLTDFGFDFAVASMKGVLLKSIPHAQIVDIDHSLKKFSIASAAFILAKNVQYFPDTMIFICIVDPGVGTERDMLCLKQGTQWFVGPNNGIFHYLFKDTTTEVYRIKKTVSLRSSRTFHGRDLFTPFAIKLSQGVYNFLEHIPHNETVTLPDLDDKTLITYIDSFGNIKTNINLAIEPSIGQMITIAINSVIHHNIPWVEVFDQAQQGQPLCYKGSNDTLEIAVNNGSAAQYFNADVGSTVVINW